MTKLILIVEDNEFNRDMLSRRLKKKGYEVCAVADGREFIDVLKTISPNIVLLDIIMPVMDGLTALKKVRTDKANPTFPVIGLSAHAREDEKQKAFEAGCIAYQTKPVDLDILIAKIEELTN